MPTLEMTRLGAAADEERVDFQERSKERFDRIAFAQRALDLVAPRTMTIAVCEGLYHLRVEAGRYWGRGPGQTWAIVSVPPTASRRAIALAVAELTALAPTKGGPYRASADAFAFDLLMAEATAEPG
jgi:hypothetical protein